MQKTTVILILAFCFCAASGLRAQDDAFSKLVRPAFSKSCFKCHGEGPKVKGKVNLLELKSSADLRKNPELLEKIIEALDSGEMPPEKAPPLAAETRQGLVVELKKLLRQAVDSQKSVARTPIRRMNRFQYNNAVKDLFQLKVEVFPLPEKNDARPRLLQARDGQDGGEGQGGEPSAGQVAAHRAAARRGGALSAGPPRRARLRQPR